jgi:hypothetical protein
MLRRSPLPSLSRRAALTASLAALAIRPAEAISVDLTSPAILDLRRLVPLARAALSDALDIEGQPGFEEAYAHANALEEDIDQLAASIWATPAQTLGDCIARAELANYWAYRDPITDRLEGLSAECVWERSMAELLEAVLTVGSRHV